LDLCLTYLSKKLKIIIFENTKDKINTKCIKVILSEKDKNIDLKDQALIDLSMQIRNIEKKINELETESNTLTNQAKNLLRNKEKDVKEIF
jgi:hypothetical protein